MALALRLTGNAEAGGKMEVAASFWVGVLILAALGGAVAVLFKESKTQKAVVLGLGLPALVQIAGRELPNKDKLPRSGNVGIYDQGFDFFPRARAEGYPDPKMPTTNSPVISGRHFATSVTTPTQDFKIRFFDSTGSVVTEFKTGLEDSFSAPVPDQAVKVEFGALGDMKQMQLTAGSNTITQFGVNLNIKKRYSFLQAFGIAPREEANIKVSQSIFNVPPPGSEGWIPLNKRTDETNPLWNLNRSIGTTNSVTQILKPRKVFEGANSSGISLGVIPAGSTVKWIDSVTLDKGDEKWVRIKVE